MEHVITRQLLHVPSGTVANTHKDMRQALGITANMYKAKRKDGEVIDRIINQESSVENSYEKDNKQQQ